MPFSSCSCFLFIHSSRSPHILLILLNHLQLYHLYDLWWTHLHLFLLQLPLLLVMLQSSHLLTHNMSQLPEKLS